MANRPAIGLCAAAARSKAVFLLLLVLWACPALAQQGRPSADRPRVALVLSGGGARGLAHVGVLKVLVEQRVPIDFVVGTSMGAIIGGSFALGMTPLEIETTTRAADWDRMFTDQPPRTKRSIHSREIERSNITGAEIGVRDGALQYPRGAIYGQQIDLFLHGLAPRLGPLASFDLLPIPYRAVATDLETGQPVVLDHGDLSQAMRASMSVPGVFAPLEVDGRLLADGGLVRNLPVDVARALGADVIIAVDVGAPLRNRHQLQSVLDVSQQVINILTGQNVRESLQQLAPGDVLVLPELAGIGAGDFDDIDRIIASGEAAARAVSDGWRELALDPAEYARWRAQLRAREAEPERIDAVRVDAAGLKHVNPEAVEARLRVRPDPKFDPGRLLDDVQSIYAMDDFERVSWRVDDEGGQRVLVVVPEEKEWGPDYLQFGVNLATDLSGSSSFSVLLAERSTWLNRAGLEWRNEVTVGRTTGLGSELYQPLAAGSRWFVAPSLHLSQQRDDLYEGDSPVATYRVRSAAFDLDLGRRLSDTASLRVGLERGSTRAVPGVAVPGFPNRSDAIGVWQLKLSDDRFDAWAFPASGEYGFAQLRVARLGLGSGSDYERAEVGEDLALSIGPWRGVIGARGGRSRGGTLPFDEYFALGGFLNLSGYNPREFLGTRYALGRILLSRRTELIGLKNGYLGASLEAGSVGERLNGPATGILPSATAFIGLDTPLGPTAFGLGMGKASHFAVYVFLGRP